MKPSVVPVFDYQRIYRDLSMHRAGEQGKKRVNRSGKVVDGSILGPVGTENITRRVSSMGQGKDFMQPSSKIDFKTQEDIQVKQTVPVYASILLSDQALKTCFMMNMHNRNERWT